MLNRVVGIYLVGVAVVVAAHTIIEPLYHVSTEARPYSPLWSLLNPLMTVAIGLGLGAAWRCKRVVDSEGLDAPLTRSYVVANTLFFGLLFFGILYVWNWINLQSPDFTAIPQGTVSLVWIIVDAALPLLWATTGIALLRGHGQGNN